MSSNMERLLEYIYQLLQKIEHPALSIVLYAGLAQNYLTLGLKESCAEVLKEALRRTDKIKLPEEKSVRLAICGRILYLCGDKELAQDTFKRAVLLSRAVEKPDQKTSALYQIAGEYIEAGDNNNTRILLEEIYQTASSFENKADKSVEMISAAEMSADIGDTETAERILEETVEIVYEIDDEWFKAQRLIEISQTYQQLENKQKMLDIAATALDIADKVEDINRLDFLLSIVDIYTDEVYVGRADEILTSALGIVSTNRSSPTFIQDAAKVAERFLDLDNRSEIDNLISMVEETFKIIESPVDKINGLLLLSGLLTKLNRVEEAKRCYGESFENIENLSDSRSQIYLLGKLAAVCIRIQDRDSALKSVNMIKVLAGDKRAKTSGLGSIAEEIAGYDEYGIALELVAAIKQVSVRAETLINLCEGIISSGQNYDEAVDHFLAEAQP